MMVVALLSILFVVGVAFLNSVTYQARSIDSAKKAETRAAVVAGLLREVREELRMGFVGNDGHPWNQDDPASLIGRDFYGEIPGVHPLIASIDPHQEGSNWVFFSSTDLERTLQNKVAAFDPTYFPKVVVNTALQDRDPAPDEFREQGSIFDFNDDGDPIDSAYYRRDADGDAVPDSYEHELPLSRYSPSVRGNLGTELRADGETDDDLHYVLRVLSHGGMVNLNHAHDTILRALLTFEELDPDEATYLEGPFSPISEEADLRRRFLLPSLGIPPTELQQRGGQIPASLYNAFVSNLNDFNEGDEDARWWPIETGEDGGDPDDINDLWLTKWLRQPPDTPMFDPAFSPNGDFAKRHLLTTVSYDDQLMRMGRATADPTMDWRQDLYKMETDATDTTLFRIDEWPNPSDPTNPLNGRQKVSLPGLDAILWNSTDPDGILPAQGVNGLSTVSSAEGITDRERFIFTIQDAFGFMLRNVDMDGSGALDAADIPLRPPLAAALTANLIDFADIDGDPIRVQAVLEDGTVLNQFAYGLERQPYITELYGLVKESAGEPPQIIELSFAIELYNPYDQPINLNGYRLNDAEQKEPAGLNQRRLNDLRLDGITIPAGEFRYFYAEGDDPFADPAVQNAGTAVGSGVDWVMDQDSQIQLQRDIAVFGGPNVVITVDQFDPVGTGLGNRTGAANDVSVERDTADWAPGKPKWRFTVPVTQAQLSGHTLGGMNNYVDITNTIMPVQIDCADSDTGRLAAVFPTTASMLLLSRFANMETVLGATFTPFTAQLATDSALIDNGRMPIFDGSKMASGNTGPLDLNIPWGQLLFDYFTALPMAHEYDRIATAPVDMTPTVDQNGLRVHGRLDINAAPWTVLAGLPLMPAVAFDELPASLKDKIVAIAGLDPSVPTPIGPELAQSIVAYREARQVAGGPGPQAPRLRSGTGFLTVGELANVRGMSGTAEYNIDLNITDDFVDAAAVLISLGDWATTRSHVFTVYGTLRGSGTKSAVDQKAIRFQETVDRLPSVFKNGRPKRIGQLIVNGYTDARHD